MIRLPDFACGTDRQRGEALFNVLQQPGASRLRDIAAGNVHGIDTKQSHIDNVDLITALRLAHGGNYIAAGAVYFLWKSRLLPRWKRHLKIIRAGAARQ